MYLQRKNIEFQNVEHLAQNGGGLRVPHRLRQTPLVCGPGSLARQEAAAKQLPPAPSTQSVRDACPGAVHPRPRTPYLPAGPTYLPGGRPRAGSATYLPGGRRRESAQGQQHSDCPPYTEKEVQPALCTNEPRSASQATPTDSPEEPKETFSTKGVRQQRHNPARTSV